jgi:hypothetical protein
MLETFVGFLNEKLRRLRHFADIVGLVEVDVEALKQYSDVEVDNVSVFQGPVVRNAMANYLVDGSKMASMLIRAEGFREMVVIQR